MPKDKHKKTGRKKKAGKKSSQFAIRLEKSERDAFVDLCEALDTSAAREIRRFMREFVASHRTAGQTPPETAPASDEAASGPEAPMAAQRPAPATPDVETEAPKKTRSPRARKPAASEAGAPKADAPAKPRAPRRKMPAADASRANPPAAATTPAPRVAAEE